VKFHIQKRGHLNFSGTIHLSTSNRYVVDWVVFPTRLCARLSSWLRRHLSVFKFWTTLLNFWFKSSSLVLRVYSQLSTCLLTRYGHNVVAEVLATSCVSLESDWPLLFEILALSWIWRAWTGHWGVIAFESYCRVNRERNEEDQGRLCRDWRSGNSCYGEHDFGFFLFVDVHQNDDDWQLLLAIWICEP